MKKVNKKKIYFIEWHDAHASAGWHLPEEVDKFIDHERCICQEVGWLLSETKNEIVMASRTLKWTKEGSGIPEWGLLQKIPKAWIRKKLLIRIQ